MLSYLFDHESEAEVKVSERKGDAKEDPDYEAFYSDE